MVFESLLGTDGDLSREALARGKNRRANNRGKPRIQQRLAADDNKHAELPRVTARLVNAIQFAAFHRLLGAGLIVQDVFGLGVEAVGGGIYAREVAGVESGPTTIAKIAAQNAFDQGGSRGLRASEAIELLKNVLGECDGGLLLHTTNIPPIPEYEK